MSKIDKLFLFLSGSWFGILVYSSILMIGKQYTVTYKVLDMIQFVIYMLSVIVIGYFTILIFKK